VGDGATIEVLDQDHLATWLAGFGFACALHGVGHHAK
jgi:hypothetical protein